jgi:hypothetical protein
VLANGNHTVSVTVKDLANNQSQASWSFTVDNQPPVLNIQVPSGSITGAAMVAMSVSSDEDLSAAPVLSLLLPDGSALELTPSVITPSRQWSASYQLSTTSPSGTYSLYVTGSDLLENQITASNQFQVMSSLPVITLRGEAVVRIDAGSTYSDPGATAVYLNTDVSSQIIVSNPVNANLPGAYDVTYNVTCEGRRRSQSPAPYWSCRPRRLSPWSPTRAPSQSLTACPARLSSSTIRTIKSRQPRFCRQGRPPVRLPT